MALTSCLKCSGVVSTKASACPHCGEPVLASNQPIAPTLPADDHTDHRKSVLDSDISEHPDIEGGADIGKSVRETIYEFRNLDFNVLFPLGKLFSGQFLRKKAVMWVLTIGLFPLALLSLVAAFNLRFEQSLWLLGGYFCYFWAVYFNGLVRPQRSLWKRGIGYFFFTLLMGLPLLFVWQQFPLISAIRSGTSSTSLFGRVVGYVLGVGLFEETCKALPLLFFSLRRNAVPVREGVFLGFMSGLGFALAEIVKYSVNYWQETAWFSAKFFAEVADHSLGATGAIDAEQFASKMGQMVPTLGEQYGIMVIGQFMRFISAPLLHAAWAGTVGWFIAVGSSRSSSCWIVTAIGIVFVALLHGLYDTFSGSLISVVVSAFSILAFLCYVMQADEIDQTSSQQAQQ